MDLPSRWAHPDEASAIDFLLGRMGEPDRNGFAARLQKELPLRDFVAAIEMELIEEGKARRLPGELQILFDHAYTRATPPIDGRRGKKFGYLHLAASIFVLGLIAWAGAVWLTREKRVESARVASSTPLAIAVREFAPKLAGARSADGSDAVLTLTGRDEVVLFRFKGVHGNPDHAVLFDEDFNKKAALPVLIQTGVPSVELTAANLKPGSYVWRLEQKGIPVATFQFSAMKN